MRLEDVTRKFRCEMDEIEADRLCSVVTAQKQIDEVEQKFNDLSSKHQAALKSNESLEKNLEEALHSIEMLKQKASMTSQLMTSSSGEMESKRTKMDDSVMTSSNYDITISMHEHQMTLEKAYKSMEKQRNELANSFKKKEEDSTRRRQMVFNSAIQRVTMAKDNEIQRLKKILADQSLMTSSMMTSSVQHDSAESDVTQASSSTKKDKDKIAISNFQVDDLVMVMFDTLYHHHVVVTQAHTLHFLHNDSITELGLKHTDASTKPWTIARFIDREYCQARKANNRFKVPVGTKFYRVRLSRK
uniref:Autophagy-related protein 11 C-terminal domain-containing protein n=1 Tax=Ciona savignyi TaxID=51511 RepID=H2YL37_CIOSA